MKIYSWNMLYRNLEQDRAFEFISSLDFDALCLQEVPDAFLARLSALDYHLVSTTDAVLTRGRKRATLHHVILTPHRIHRSGTFEMPPLALSLRPTIVLLLKEWWLRFGERQGVYADIEFPVGTTRVFSLHLSVLSPRSRILDLKKALEYMPESGLAILTGDFNIVDHPITRPFCWFFGSSLSEALPWYDERGKMEDLFQAFVLKNPLRGKTTLGVTLSQLDHILVPATASVLRAEVIKDTYGSDHNPILVEVA